MNATIIIPARLHSTRLERKLLLSETGKPLIQHTYEAAQTSRLAENVIVATDSKEILDVVESFGGTAVMTARDHVSGTDRVAEAARDLKTDLIVNVQGDEPEIEGATIDCLIELFSERPDAQLATLAAPIKVRSEFEDPACVKVVVNHHGKALYFSRSAIPGMKTGQDFENRCRDFPNQFLKHLGIYAFRHDSLQEICRLAPTELEQIESLEQLRFLEHGYQVFVKTVEHFANGIDTPEDYASFVNRHRKG